MRIVPISPANKPSPSSDCAQCFIKTHFDWSARASYAPTNCFGKERSSI